ncbi:hypothetical protein AJM72_00960 [Campylobacter jejuni]|uniref:hypothetical protein n=1 Tax=Campylobacter jejuni TaxID=197 RepID=UPI000873C59E|nr:hypothetical protein [Campylobacter jejuni]OEV68723.1 hypothetical protein AJM72_00960 [Campylobacter jejuni]OEW51063.1 hypothetical protein AJM74_04215 [Campylobacter jejuni]OEX75928.1 hypothetical protein A0K60_03540 [Campylobacter jejuni]
MGTSLNELKTGREKLEIINQVLARINSISEAIDNTRLDEVVGLKQACEGLKNECLAFKNSISEKSDDILSKYNDINNKYSKINEKYSDLSTKFDYIKEAYEDFNLNKEELKNIKDFLENNKEEFEKLKKDIQKYEEIKFNLENYINEIKQNKDFVEDYFNLNTKIKDEILSELDHALEIVENLHLNVDELKEIKPDLVNIKKEVKDLANEAKLVVSEASEIIKNKINTIFFENQRLNAEMIDAVKKLEEIKFDVGIKYKEIASAYDLLLESKQNVEDLKEVIALYKEFENDVLGYSQIIKDFKNQIANLEQDLMSKSENIHASLDNKQDEILKNLNDVKNEALIKFDELVAKCEGYKVHFEQSYDKFNQRALIANEDLGRLAELAKKELGNDKLIYETELKSLRDETIATMNKISSDLSSEKNNILLIFEDKKQEFINLVDTSKIMIDNLNNIFNTNYQEKKNELGLFISENLENLSQNKEDFLKELEDKKEQGKNELKNKTDESLQILNATKTNILEEINATKTNILEEINAINDTAKSEIEQLKDTSLNAISEAKNNADTEISSKKDEILLEFSKATSDFNNIKEEAFSQIEQAKLEQGEKILKLEEGQKSINLTLETNQDDILNIKEDLKIIDDKYSKVLTENLKWKLGKEEQFTSLKQVFEEASKYSGNYIIRIFVEDGFEINEFNNAYNGSAILEFWGDKIIIKDTIQIWDNCINIGRNSSIRFFNIKIQSNAFDNLGIFVAGNGRAIFIKVSFTGKYNFCIYFEGYLSLNEINMDLDKGSIGVAILLSGFLDIITDFTCNNAKKAIEANLGGKGIIRGHPTNITNCDIGINVIVGGLIDLYNKSVINFSGTTTQYSQALNTQTKNGYIRG